MTAILGYCLAAAGIAMLVAGYFRKSRNLMLAGTIALVLSFHTLVHRLFDYPEMIGLMMAGQLLLGRYTGYRLSELLRFRDFVLKTTEYTESTERASGHALAD